MLGIRGALRENGGRVLGLIASPIGLLILFVVVYSAIHIFTWALIRYRLPVDAVLVPFAGLALSDVARRFSIKA
jgi:hypothetical protein